MLELLIKNINNYIELDKDEMEFFLSKLHTIKLKKKQYLLKADSICRQESFIIKGCFRKYYLDNDGVEHVILFATEESWLNEPQSFWGESPSFFSIEALEPSEIIQIQKPDLEKILSKIPKFERFFRIIGNKVFEDQQKRIKQNLSCSSEERYNDFKKDYPGLELRVPQKHIASYLGITPEFFSVLQKKERIT